MMPAGRFGGQDANLRTALLITMDFNEVKGESSPVVVVDDVVFCRHSEVVAYGRDARHLLLSVYYYLY